MPALEADIVSILTGASAVTSLVGNNIFPIPGKQGTPKPYLVYQRVSTVPVRGLGGTHNFGAHRIQITCWGRNYKETKDLGRAVRQALDSASDGTVFENEFDLSDESAGLYTVLEFIVQRRLDT